MRTPAPAAGLVVVLALVGASLASAEGESTATVDVNVGTFRSTKGWLGCRLYSSATGFPREPASREQRVAIPAGIARCTFTNVPAGTYAVAVMHDENGNGKLDSNFLGIPTEGYGVSNNHTHAMSSPTWDESRFELKAGQEVRLGISLRY